MRDLWGNTIKTDTKICRDCKEEKSIEEFAINRKFYRQDLPEKHTVLRRPSCNTCRDKKKKISKQDKKFYAKPIKLTCPICNDEVSGDYARLDHDHNTGRIRGWICDNCNTAIGKLKESKEVLMRAIEWIENK
jgi:hypothetical protein